MAGNSFLGGIPRLSTTAWWGLFGGVVSCHAAVFTVINTDDGGGGSLRQAILDSNASVGVMDSIEFNIPGDGPHTIQPLSALPAIIDPVEIDGFTQPGSTRNSNPTGQGLNTVIGIELDGTNAGGDTSGLQVDAGGDGSVIRGLAINRFANVGVLLVNASDTRVEGCFIGTDVSGRTALANGDEGIVIAGGDTNKIGGTAPEDRNLISGNNSHGVIIVRSGVEFAVGNMVQGNLIGTDIAGATEIENALSGVLILLATDTLVGGTEEGASNLISGNGSHGIEFGDSAERNRIQGNRIGTDVSGTFTLGNGSSGIEVSSAFPPAIDNLIGGSEAGAGNLIGGNGSGVHIQGGSNRTTVQGNTIGTDETGTLDLGNQAGIRCFVSGNEFIENTIANNAFGISLGMDSLVQRNTIFSNFIGINVAGGGSNLITENSIFDNEDLGIDLIAPPPASGPNFPQDLGDGDTGPNDLQNFPILSSVTESATGTRIEGDLSSRPDSTYRIEFFANATQDPSGFGEGKTFIGDILVMTDGAGEVSFFADVDPLPAGEAFVTSTATDITVRPPETEPANNTSEFSPAPTIEGQGLTVTATVGESGLGTLNEAIRAANNTPGLQTIRFNVPADDPGHVYYRNDGIAGNVTPASVTQTTETNDANIADIDPDWPHSWWRIVPESRLNEVTDPVIIDGYTQPGSVPNTQPVGNGLDSVLRIEIDGTEASKDPIQLRFGFLRIISGNCVVRGLAINRVDGPKLWLDGVSTAAANCRVEGNYLGPDISGGVAFPALDATEVLSSHVGVHINSASANIIGGATLEARNLISANNGDAAAGVTMSGFGAAHNLVQGNLIGTDRSGTRVLGDEQIGVQIGGVPDNVIGGSDPAAANVISGNRVGLDIGGIFGPRNVIEGNLIGPGGDGSIPLGNREGVLIRSPLTRVEENTIAYNGSGVTIGDGTGNLMARNSIFLNDGLGIDLVGPGPNDVPPESDPPDQDAGPNNLQNFPVLTSVINNGGGAQVEGILQSTPNSNFRIEFFSNANRDPSNFGEGQTFLDSIDISTDGSGNANFTADLPTFAADQGFVTATATDITVRPPAVTPANDTSEFSQVEPLGGCSFTVTNTGDVGLGTLREAITCANVTPGSQTIDFAIPPDDPGHFYYRDDGIAGTVTPASIATTVSVDDAALADVDPDWPHSWFSIRPDSDLPAIGDTVFIDGYTQPGSRRNTVPAGEGLDTVLKIEINGTNGSGHGLDLGLLPEVNPSRHRIEGLVINRWSGNGIVLDTFGFNQVAGCFIGTDVSGTVPEGNGENGIFLSNESGNLLGGQNPQDRNLISANLSDGVELAVFSSNNDIQGNLIGLNRLGVPGLGNGESGVFINESSINRVGGIFDGEGNRFGDNGGPGIRVSRETKSNAPPQERKFEKGDGDTCSLVGDKGSCADCSCHCDDDDCVLSCGDKKGSECDCTGGCSDVTAQAISNPLRGNTYQTSIAKGGSDLGIDLGDDGVTENDSDDPLTLGIDPDSDLGPNRLQNFPILMEASTDGLSTTVTGILESVTETNFMIDFYRVAQCHSSGHGLADQYLVSEAVTTDSNGFAMFVSIVPLSITPGEFVASTATRLLGGGDDGDTSEFSACIQVTGSGPTPTPTQPGPCPDPFPDYNMNGRVDGDDLLLLLKGLRDGDPSVDLTQDGLVMDDDVIEFSRSWQRPDCVETP